MKSRLDDFRNKPDDEQQETLLAICAGIALIIIIGLLIWQV